MCVCVCVCVYVYVYVCVYGAYILIQKLSMLTVRCYLMSVVCHNVFPKFFVHIFLVFPIEKQSHEYGHLAVVNVV